ncbi:(2Fe-2S)-binding protein (plasmid) [Rhizobium sp. T1470]|uniref:(2Fe-2S)-binding protein n=1 Tax=unclassified Rhizobium TaxID=2613769 RepID=UPI001AAFBB31|nr:(2Fe-2S)-binding protein [Rhizobium sp. T1473]MCA0806586.1 (2Fe-2S)-binding protein [Rhizobium sp. T1473]
MTLEKCREKSFKRLCAIAPPVIEFAVDGQSVMARAGETVLVALNTELGHVRNFEFHHERRAGFCFMGACQDCWLWKTSGERIRACTSLVEAGMSLSTVAPEVRA